MLAYEDTEVTLDCLIKTPSSGDDSFWVWFDDGEKCSGYAYILNLSARFKYQDSLASHRSGHVGSMILQIPSWGFLQTTVPATLGPVICWMG